MRNTWMLLLLALFILVSCGGQQQQVDPQKVAEPLSISNQQLYKISQPLARAGVPAPVFISPFAKSVSALDTAEWNCSKVTATGNLTDGDNDGIPVDAVYNGKCTWGYSNGSGSATGYWEFKALRVQDPNDRDPDAGVKASGSIVWGVESGGNSITFTWKLDKHNLERQGGGHKFDFKGTWTIAGSGDTYIFNYDMSGDWTPDSSSDPWGDGVMNARGSFSGSGPSCTSWSTSFTLTSVHFSEDEINSGSGVYDVTDCGGNTAHIEVNWATRQICVTADGNTICNSF